MEINLEKFLFEKQDYIGETGHYLKVIPTLNPEVIEKVNIGLVQDKENINTFEKIKEAAQCGTLLDGVEINSQPKLLGFVILEDNVEVVLKYKEAVGYMLKNDLSDIESVDSMYRISLVNLHSKTIGLKTYGEKESIRDTKSHEYIMEMSGMTKMCKINLKDTVDILLDGKTKRVRCSGNGEVPIYVVKDKYRKLFPEKVSKECKRAYSFYQNLRKETAGDGGKKREYVQYGIINSLNELIKDISSKEDYLESLYKTIPKDFIEEQPSSDKAKILIAYYATRM